MTTAKTGEQRKVGLGALSETALGGLRLHEPASRGQLARSMRRRGQLEPLLTFQHGGELEVIDGFKRLHVARDLGWSDVRVVVVDVSLLEAKVLVAELHGRQGLSALEEGWLIRSLHREHRLSQGAIAERLGRHKSWVCRRLLLAEGLCDALQAQVRLGLLSAKAAVEVAALPRGNQQAAGAVVIRRGLTVRQTQLFVQQLREAPQERHDDLLQRWSRGEQVHPNRRPRSCRSEDEWLLRDVTIVRDAGARLQARLLARPAAPDAGTEDVLRLGLEGLEPVVSALGATLRRTLGQRSEKGVA